MRKHLLLGSALALVAMAAAPAAQAAPCTTVNTSRGTFTAQVVDQNVPAGSNIDASGCDIAVYYSAGSGSWTVTDSDVHGSLWYGVYNDGANVSISGSQVHDIGDDPKNGVQRGLAVLFNNRNGVLSSGSVDDTNVFDYQKNGITAIGNSTIDITDSTVTGLGKVDFIAQNGIQISDGATPGDVSGNTVTDNHYSGPIKPTIATGILLFQANVSGRDVGRISSSNDVNHNQSNISYIK